MAVETVAKRVKPFDHRDLREIGLKPTGGDKDRYTSCRQRRLI